MRIHICQALPEPSVSDLLAGFEISTGSAQDSEEHLIACIRDAEAILGTPPVRLSERVIASAPRLEVIANCAVGTDNIDLAACRRRGITVTNTPGVLTETTADLTWALILAVTRRLREAENLARSGKWKGWEPVQLLGVSLQGKTLGIFGMGRIGKAVARRAEAFGMEVAGVTTTHSRKEVEDLLSGSHIISIHCPLSESTRNAFTDHEFSLMKAGAILINTARGPVVNTEALLRALDSKKLRGAGLDVYPEEPKIDPRLLERDDVVLLPHVGSATEETRLEMARTACSEIARFFAGENVRNRVV